MRLYRNESRKHGVVHTVSVQLDLTSVRRKSQFYVITFLLPCVCIAFLTVFRFLPPNGGRRETLFGHFDSLLHCHLPVNPDRHSAALRLASTHDQISRLHIRRLQSDIGKRTAQRLKNKNHM